MAWPPGFEPDTAQEPTTKPPATRAPTPDSTERDAHGNRIVRNPDGSIKFMEGPGYRGTQEGRPDRNVIGLWGDRPGGEALPKEGEVGISPEMLLGLGQAGRAVVGALKSGGGAAAGGVAAMAQAAPFVKYYGVKHILTAMGLPDMAAEAAAVAASGYSRRGPVRATGAPAAAPSAPQAGPTAPPISPPGPPPVPPGAPPGPLPGPPPGVPPSQPVPGPAPPPPAAPGGMAPGTPPPGGQYAASRAVFQQAGIQPLPAELANVEMLISRGMPPPQALQNIVSKRAGGRPGPAGTPPPGAPPSGAAPPAPPPMASLGQPTPVAPPVAAPVAAKPAWTAEEVALGQRLMAGGKTQQQAMDAIVAQRQFKQIPGTQSNAEVRAAQDLREGRGATKTPSAPTARARRQTPTVGATVTYQGKPYRVTGVRNGQAMLEPVESVAAAAATPAPAAPVAAAQDLRQARGETKTPSAQTAADRRQAAPAAAATPVETTPPPGMASLGQPAPVETPPVAAAKPVTQPVTPRRAAKAKVTTPPQAAAEVRQHVERVIDVQGLKTGKEVQGRVLDALQQELPAAQQAAGFQSLEFRPGKAYGGREGVVVVDGQPLARVDRYGKMSWLDDTPSYTTAGGKYVPSEPSPRGSIGFSAKDMTPTAVAKAAKDQVANALGKDAGLLKINVPGDGTFTIERNPHAISELLRRIGAGGPSIWQGVGDVKFSAPKTVGPKIPPASW